MAENKKFTRLINSDGTKQAVALDMVSFDEQTKKLTLYSSVDNTIKEETTIPASEVDATLSQSGLAADAKATGDAVKDVVKVGGTASSFTGIIVGTGEEEIELVEQKDFDAEIAKLNAKVGTPLVANAASAMVDTTKIYVYTGNENGYVNGNWYFYNGTNWESGGVYNAVAVQTDKTLTQENKAADAKKTGDEISQLMSDLSESGINSPFNVRYAVELNKYLRKSDGTVVSNNGLVSKITDYISCESGDEFKYYGLGSGSIASVVWYDIDKVFISAEQYNKETMTSDPQTVTAPSGAKYARFSSYKYGSDGSSVIFKISRTVPTSFGIESDFKTLSDKMELVSTQYWNVERLSYTAIPYVAYENKKLNASDGTVVTASGVVSKITDYIPCAYGDVYQYNGYGSGTLSSVCFYDIDKNFISSAVYNSEPWYTQIDIPSGAYYVRFASNKFGSDTSEVIFGVYKDFGKSFDTFQTLAGKKWLVIGDSWVASSTLGNGVRNFVEYVREKTKLTLYNKGVGGTGYWKGHGSGIAFYQRAANLTEEADIVTVFGSLNDMGLEDGVYGSQILGTYTDSTTSTVCGCINATLDALETKYPNALINVITPCPWSNSHDNDYPNQYANAIKQICEHRSIPCLDLYHGSSLRPWDATFLSTYYVDGAHANTLGHKRFSGMIQKFIESVCYIDN